MFQHPAAGCSPQEIEVFEKIAINQSQGHPPEIIQALMDKGLISNQHGAHYVPVAVHYQWCEWCGAQAE